MFDKRLLESSELYDKRYQNFATIVIFPVLILFVGFMIFAVFAKKELIVTDAGDIEPIKVVAQIQSTSSNIIVRNNLEEGKTVKTGELLVQYNGEANNTEMVELKAQLKDVQSQKTELALLQESLTKGQNKFSKVDTYGFYQTFEDYESQIKSLTDNVNKANQAVDNQNRTVANELSEIQQQIGNLNGQINDYTAFENALNTGVPLSNNNLYYGQYASYQNQAAMLQATATAAKAETAATAKATVTNEEQKAATQMSQAAEQANVNSQLASLKGSFLSNISSNLSNLQSQKQSLSVELSGLMDNNSYDNSLNSQLLSLKAQALTATNKQMTDLESSILQLNTKIALQQQENQYSEVLSPDYGVLHVSANTQGAKQVGSGTVLAEIYPALKYKSKVNLTVYVPSTEISGVKLGQTLRFTVQQNLPKAEILVGKINHIDSVPTELKSINAYKITAQTIIKSSDVNQIRYGLEGKAVVVIGEKTYFDYYWDKLRGES